MAERPVFLSCKNSSCLVEERVVSFPWHKGMAASQKKKNVLALHQVAASHGLEPLLEVSTKSEDRLGQRLSAFNLKVTLDDATIIPLECAYQGSKVFENGGPYTDLYMAEGREAKRDARLQSSGRLVAFSFNGVHFPLLPKTAFYDWLYIQAIFPHRDYLSRLHTYAGFTDIEFNPQKSINCQARSCAMFVSLDNHGLLVASQESPEAFIDILLPDSIQQPHSYPERQHSLFET